LRWNVAWYVRRYLATVDVVCVLTIASIKIISNRHLAGAQPLHGQLREDPDAVAVLAPRDRHGDIVELERASS